VKSLKEPTTVRIGLADHQTLCRQGVKRLLEAERGLLVVGEANDDLEALRLTEDRKPDILLLEWMLPRMTGSDVLRAIGPACGSTRVIILTDQINRAEIHTALQLGARGVVLKVSDCRVLIRAIRGVVRGEYWIGRQSVADFVQVLRTGTGFPLKDAPRQFGLTAREWEIVHAVSAACANKEIAQRFSISEKTVKHHLSNIFVKLGVSTRLELAVFALNNRDKLHDVPASTALKP
jgi:two-component system nitrate/nitrite response regulator NarL